MCCRWIFGCSSSHRFCSHSCSYWAPARSSWSIWARILETSLGVFVIEDFTACRCNTSQSQIARLHFPESRFPDLGQNLSERQRNLIRLSRQLSMRRLVCQLVPSLYTSWGLSTVLARPVCSPSTARLASAGTIHVTSTCPRHPSLRAYVWGKIMRNSAALIEAHSCSVDWTKADLVATSPSHRLKAGPKLTKPQVKHATLRPSDHRSPQLCQREETL